MGKQQRRHRRGSGLGRYTRPPGGFSGHEDARPAPFNQMVRVAAHAPSAAALCACLRRTKTSRRKVAEGLREVVSALATDYFDDLYLVVKV
jgi:hypothetical protein